jgi:hypothetical protein
MRHGMTEKANLTIRQFMEYQSIGKTKAYQLAHDPDFYPAFKIGGKILINLDKLKKWNFDQSMRKGEHDDQNH